MAFKYQLEMRETRAGHKAYRPVAVRSFTRKFLCWTWEAEEVLYIDTTGKATWDDCFGMLFMDSRQQAMEAIERHKNLEGKDPDEIVIHSTIDL